MKKHLEYFLKEILYKLLNQRLQQIFYYRMSHFLQRNFFLQMDILLPLKKKKKFPNINQISLENAFE